MMFRKMVSKPKPEAPGPRRSACARLGGLALTMTLGLASVAQAQVYDPYTPQVQTQGGSGSGSAQQSVGAQAMPMTGSTSAVAVPSSAAASFNPISLPSYTAHEQGEFNDQTAAGRSTLDARKHLPPPLSEFETYVSQWAGHPLQRFGSALLINGATAFASSPTTAVPPDYRLNPGDQLLVGVTGSVEGDLQLVVDSEGRIFIPRIGQVEIAGIRYGDLAAALTRRFEDQYKKVKVSVVIGHLHGLTVYVTGFAASPGAYTVSSLSTMVDAVLAAGGPASGGSFRNVQLQRGGQVVATLDLYDLLLKGDKSRDAVLQNEDVLNIGPVGPELAITGSINQEAIYEAKPGETLGDMIRYAGGLNSLADASRVLVARLGDLDRAGSQQLDFAAAQTFPAERGDIVRILSVAGMARPLERQAILATIEGEVDHPGRYYLKPGSTVGDLLAQSGGLTDNAFVYGTVVSRDSLRLQEKASFDRAIAELQLNIATAPLSATSGISADRAAAAAARAQAAKAILDQLKEQKPDGRLVLSLPPDARALPPTLALETNDRIYVPPRPTTVGVFGAVYQTGSFLYSPGARISTYIHLAGGPKRIADSGDIFVVRANGSVLSMEQTHDLEGQHALPGDVVFVPVRTSGGVFEKILAIAAVVYQLGVGALTIRALGL
jgi:polysaccharide biosynthesis/export protein